MAKVTWDQDSYETSTGFEVIPRGVYPCMIIGSSEKKTKAQTGSYFEFEFEVVKGDYKKRKLWARLNINNPSEVAERIGREQFKALCAAAGKPGAKTTEALHDKFVACIVSIERNGDKEMNRVDGFKSMQEAGFGSGGAAATKEKESSTKKKTDEEDDDDIPF